MTIPNERDHLTRYTFLNNQAIPAQAGDMAVVCYFQHDQWQDDNRMPTDKDIIMISVPVIAWIISKPRINRKRDYHPAYCALPVLPMCLPEWSIVQVCIPLPNSNGQFLETELPNGTGQEYPTEPTIYRNTGEIIKGLLQLIKASWTTNRIKVNKKPVLDIGDDE
jgi:hypothetical protein